MRRRQNTHGLAASLGRANSRRVVGLGSHWSASMRLGGLLMHRLMDI